MADSDPLPLDFETLKAKQRSLRDGFPINLGLRVHRALSWAGRAEKEADDPDARFLFYWIAFNAAYAEDTGNGVPIGSRSLFNDYFGKILAHDPEHRIYRAIWGAFSNSIRILLDNQYVFEPFWKHNNQVPGYEDWEDRFKKSKKRTNSALMNKDTQTILSTLFDRMYVLRNQIMHGGATWNSSVNRSQVQDGANILAFAVPHFVDIMMDNPELTWGMPYYPVVD